MVVFWGPCNIFFAKKLGERGFNHAPSCAEVNGGLTTGAQYISRGFPKRNLDCFFSIIAAYRGLGALKRAC